MKNLIRLTVVAICILVFILQIPDEVQGLKKVLKKAKKLKKYAWILATQRKKFYAIPFPMPLPVFVKRQQIYTQIPIIPRYVQHPQPYGSPAMSSYSAESSSAAATSYPQMSASEMMSLGTRTTPSEIPYPSAGGFEYFSQQYPVKSRRVKKKLYQQQQSTSGHYQQQQQNEQQLTTTSLPTTGKYLQQIAAALAQNYQNTLGSSSGASGGSGSGSGSPTSGVVAAIGIGSGGHRDVLSKLLTGQAKVLLPTSLLSSIKSSAVAAATGSASASSSAQTTSQQDKKAAHNDLYDQNQTDQTEQDNSNSSSSSENSAKSTSSKSTNYNGGGGGGSGGSISASDAADTKTAASEFYRTLPKPLRIRMNQLAQMQREQQLSIVPINRLNAFGMPTSPFAAAMAASQMQRIPMLQSPFDNYQQQQQAAVENQLDDSQQQQPDQQLDIAASQDNEQLAAIDGGIINRQQLLDRQRQIALLARQAKLQQLHRQQQQQQLQESRINPVLAERLLASRQRQEQLQQQQQQRQQLYRLALAAREQQEAAAQLAESRAILVKAQQLGLFPPAEIPRAIQLDQLLRQKQ